MYFQLRSIVLSGAYGARELRVLYASTPSQRAQGLQHARTTIPMLFDWGDRKVRAHTLHMQNVRFPLDAYGFDTDGFLCSHAFLRPGQRASVVGAMVLEVPMGAYSPLRERTRMALLAPEGEVTYVEPMIG